MQRIITGLLFLSVVGAFVAPEPTPQFKRYFVAAESYESVGVFDVDKNDTLDLVSGDFWYEGPSFRRRHLIGNEARKEEYYDDFSTIPLDVNGDGNLDFVTGGWWGGILRWVENPGPAKSKKNEPWPVHEIGPVGNVETTRAWDIDGDGVVEIVPNNPGHPLKYIKLTSPGVFKTVTVAPTQGHGLGFGDVNGDGRGDFIVSDGWLEAPTNREAGNWSLHKEFSFGSASVPIVVADVNGDRLNDLIVGQAHGYGLHWYEQIRDGNGKRAWTKHLIDDKNSQYHCLEWMDITGDGRPDLVTGKRFRAHNDNDPGTEDPVGLYYFTWNATQKRFEKHDIAYGPAGGGKGTGIYFAVVDLHKKGRKDIVVAGKDGLVVFFNEGAQKK
ncbi:FG-GAP repeat domain-containing protein [Spirosoma oryzicola]|uniref:FG-GAP repeat domain-containing protein n=1 Tax=Spirosoma oryzicola TaxID=2898794 RepID=UPI001E418EF5|nr:VCBS repeat-containing protein [Spirosoma oryzicola]UHG92298.1 VCBS repeat-containing protein [Spirosoma oryzicola]